MSTPTRIAEIMAEMEQNPELADELRNRLLGADYSGLPTAVAQNQSLIVSLMEKQAELAHVTRTAMEALAGTVEILLEAVSEATEILTSQGKRLEVVEQMTSDLRTAVSALQTDMTEVKADIVEVKADIVEVKADIVEVKADIVEVKADIVEVKADIRKINGRLDNGFGTNYEAKIASVIGSILGKNLKLRRCKVLKGYGFRMDENLEAMTERAEREEIITEDDSDEAMLLDLIVSGRRRDGEDTELAAIEVSITAGDDDVTRAAERSEILSKATGLTVTPVVIASNIDEERRKLAAEKNVTMIVHPEG